MKFQFKAVSVRNSDRNSLFVQNITKCTLISSANFLPHWERHCMSGMNIGPKLTKKAKNALNYNTLVSFLLCTKFSGVRSQLIWKAMEAHGWV